MRNFIRSCFAGSSVLVVALLAIPVGISGAPAELDTLTSASASPTVSSSTASDLQSRVRTLVDWVEVGAGVTNDLTVSCPQGTVALGGGVDVSDVHSMTIFSTGPTVNGSRLNATSDGTHGAPDGWFGGVDNSDSTSRPFKVGAICVPLSGVSTVVTSQAVNPGAFGWTSAVCPAGTTAVGGGVDVEDHLLMVVTSSSPTIAGSRILSVADGSHAGPDGWRGTVRNYSSVLKTVKVGVVCQPLGGITTVISSDTAAAGSWGTQAANCPLGKIAVGGGMDVENVFTVFATETAPKFELPQATLMQRDPGVQPAPIGWQASVSNTASTGKGFKVGAICARWPLVFFRGDDDSKPDR